MSYELSEWLNLVARWFHVFTGILWIGQTYYFTWLDGRFQQADARLTQSRKPRAQSPGPGVWMVHSGGFYTVEKQHGLGVPPGELHWFRWEAAATWLSGLVLLILVYYMGGAMIDRQVADISQAAAIGIGVAALAGGWAIYDGLVRTRLVRSDRAFAVVGLLLIAASAFGLSRVLSGRATYLHIGAILGTIMAANVWMRILPAQRRMIRSIGAGAGYDPALTADAKLRSRHNTFLAMPVVVLMISNHYPVATYGGPWAWLVLSGLVAIGWVAAALVRRA